MGRCYYDIYSYYEFFLVALNVTSYQDLLDIRYSQITSGGNGAERSHFAGLTSWNFLLSFRGRSGAGAGFENWFSFFVSFCPYLLPISVFSARTPQLWTQPWILYAKCQHAAGHNRLQKQPLKSKPVSIIMQRWSLCIFSYFHLRPLIRAYQVVNRQTDQPYASSELLLFQHAR